MNKSKNLHLIDGIGAMVSAVILGIVLVAHESIFGIPTSTLYVLASIPILFAFYDGYCYLNKSVDLRKSLRGIGFLNISYCFISLLMAFQHTEKITVYGWCYLIIEITIVLTLAFVELKESKRG